MFSGAVVTWAAVAGTRILQAIDQVRSGQAAIRAAKTLMASKGPADHALLATLDQADRHFAAADHDLHSWAVFWARGVPVAGTELTSLIDLTSAAHQATDIGTRALDLLRPAFATHPSGGPATLGVLREFSSVSGQSLAALDRLRLGPKPLLAPLARRRAKLQRDLGTVEAALGRVQSAAAAVTDLLQGPHRYLVLAANNAEMRAGSGMFLEAGVLRTDGGRARLEGMQPTGRMVLPYGAVMPSGDLAARWGWLEPGAEWRNLALSPRFDVTAALARQMWQRRTGQTVDGVIAVDPGTIGAVLAATGPVPVSGATVTAADAASFLMLGQYLGALGDPAGGGRVDDLGRLAETALTRMVTGPLDTYRLARGLQQSVAGRHLLVWSADPAVEAEWEQLGAAGTLGPSSLAVAVQNVGGNKLDQFLHVDVFLSRRPALASTAFTLTVHLANHTPAGLPPYVAGPAGRGEVAGQYLGLVTITMPGHAVAVAVAGHREVPVAGPDGPTYVVAVPVSVRAGAPATVTVTFSLPGPHGSLEVEPSARIPPAQWHAPSSTFSDADPHQVAW